MSRALLVMVLCLVTHACAARAGDEDPRLRENELAIRTMLSLWQGGAVADVGPLFHPDAVYEDFASQAEYRGLEEVGRYVLYGRDWADLASLTVTALHVSATGAVAEWVFSGVQDRPIGAGISVATGRDVVVNGTTIVEIDDGRIRRAADYSDVLTVMLQLGGEMHLPGGTVLRLDQAPPLTTDSVGPGAAPGGGS